MAAATTNISETNGATVVHDSVTNLNYGTVDEYDTDYANHPITIPGNSMRKENRLSVTSMGTSTKIDNIRIWQTGTVDTGVTFQTNLETSGYASEAYVTPSTSTYTHNSMPTSEPGTANLGIAGSLSNGLTATGYSDYWHHQLQAAMVAGPGNINQKTYSLKYDEQ